MRYGQELINSLVNMKKDKASGWDSIPPELYLTFWDILGLPLQDMINTAVDKGAFNHCANSALIALLLKPNKDPSQCSNYKPLSLLNGDLCFKPYALPHN